MATSRKKNLDLVTGPASATDNALARFDLTTGKLLQDSAVTVDDSGNIATTGTVDGRDVSTDGAALDSHTADTANPHSTDLGNLGSGTLAELNALVTDATLDDASDNRTDADAVHDNVAGEISAVTEKAVPVSGDLLLIEDSAAGNVKKRVQIGNLPGGGGGSSTFAGLTDTPANFVGAADQFLKVNSTPNAVEFVDLFGSANTWTATQTIQDLLPSTDDSYDVGSDAARMQTVFGRRLKASDTSGTGVVTTAAAATGLAVGFASASSTGASTVSLNNTTAGMVSGASRATAAGDALLTATGRGATALGSSFSDSGNDATITAIGEGTLAGGYAHVGTPYGGTATANVEAAAPGSFVWGCVHEGGQTSGTGQVRSVAGAVGSFVSGLARSTIYGSTEVCTNTYAHGGFAQGYARGHTSGVLSRIESDGYGAFAQGHTHTVGGAATISSAGIGSFAQGHAEAGPIRSRGRGSFAQGHVVLGGYIYSDGRGSFAQGYSNGAPGVRATATNASQFGEGLNSVADSTRLGQAGLHFKHTSGAFGTAANGQVWMSGNFFNVRSDGADFTFNQSAVWTVTNPVVDRAFDTTTVTLQNLAEVVGTLVADLQTFGVCG